MGSKRGGKIKLTMDNYTWEQSVRLFTQAGFHDHLRSNNPVIDTLAHGDEIINHLQDMSAFVMPISEYLKTLRVVGAGSAHAHLDAGIPLRLTMLRCIISIRGFPRLSLLHHLGEKLQLKPEALLDHLDFPKSFRIGSLPSRPSPALRISMISMGQYMTTGAKLKVSDSLQQFQFDHEVENINLKTLRNKDFGAEHCRKVNLHTSDIFTVEQDVTFFPFKIHDAPPSWSGILLNDSGHQSTYPPWNPQGARDKVVQFYPFTKFGSCTVAEPERPPAKDIRDRRNYTNPDPCQSRAHTDSTILSDKDHAICLEDPIMFAADLLTTSAHSWAPVLSFLRQAHVHTNIADDPERTAERLRRDKQFLDRASHYFKTIIRFLDQRDTVGWPKCVALEDQARVTQVAEKLKEDFTALLDDSKTISQLCAEYISIAMSTISIAESKKSLSQARRVGVLTVLAFFFLPVTAVGTLFGMNVKTFTTPNPPFWVYWAVVVPVTAVSLLLPFLIETFSTMG